MQRLRSTWLALVGGALLVALSVSAAFGAPPTGEDSPRGQTVAAFVHELIFGADEETDGTEEEVVEDDENDLETDGDDEEGSEEELTEEVVEELDEDLDEDLEAEVEGEFANHGECVSEEASDKSDEDPEVDGNHGAVVSLAAQETCWEVLESGAVITDPEDDEEDVEEQVLEEEREVPDEFANHGDCVSQAAQDEEGFEESGHLTHGKWVSENARYTCWGLAVPGEDAEEDAGGESTAFEQAGTQADDSELSAKEQRKADAAAARDARKAERDAAKAAGSANRGGGHGRGGGRP